jgi:hypothetical protein
MFHCPGWRFVIEARWFVNLGYALLAIDAAAVAVCAWRDDVTGVIVCGAITLFMLREVWLARSLTR